jgi:ketosteroid isomerase-like protein
VRVERRVYFLEVKMLICTKCQIEYEEGKKFCRNCGSPLVAREEPSSSLQNIGQIIEERPKEMRICPRCKVSYESGKYCRKCGSVLVSQIPSKASEELKVAPSQEVKREKPEVQPLERKQIKGLSKEWLKLWEEERKLEDITKKLQAQRSGISSDFFNATFRRYQAQLESISSRLQEIEANLEYVREKTSEEINLTIKELKPIKKRLEEIQSLYKAGAITKLDFSRDKNELGKEIRSRENILREHKQIVALLPSKMGGAIGASEKEWNFLRPLPLAAGGVIVLLAVAGYLLWPKYYYLVKEQPQPSGPVTKADTTPASPTAPVTPTTPPPQEQPPPTSTIEAQEIESIKSLLENIRQANLQKNIDLFMSCYSPSFREREQRKAATLETWKDFDYLDLSYNLKNQTVSGDTANARVEWLIRISPRAGGQTQESKAILDVTFRKEDGVWKIKEIKPVG